MRDKTDKYFCLPSVARLPRGIRQAGESRLRLFCARGERESGQLHVLLPGAVSLETAALAGEDGTLSADCFRVYWMKYATSDSGSPGSFFFPPGEYPDALVPMDLAAAAGETVSDGGAALWITAEIPRDARPGLYRGTFALRTGDVRTDVPVELHIYDCLVPEQTMPTSFGVWGDRIDAGTPQSFEIVRAYADFFLGYRINLNWHFTDRALPDPETVADWAEAYFDHPRFTGFCLPDAQAKDEKVKIDWFRKYIPALARRSRPDRNLLEKAYAYFYDEPEGNHAIRHIEEVLDYYNATLADILAEIEADTSGAYDAFRSIDGYAGYILGFRHIGTMWLDCPSAKLLDETDMWCPPLIAYDDAAMRENAAVLKEKLGAELWWYGCIGPHYPFPTYQITDKAISARLLSWMQKAYDVTGNLYWCVAGLEHGSDRFYEDPCFSGGMYAGDGFLCYPGSRYGSIAPVPSQRLMIIADGIEDFGLLSELESRWREYETTYTGFSARRAKAAFMRDLFDGVSCFMDETVFLERRERLLALLADGSGYAVGDVRIRDGRAEFSLYAAAGALIEAAGIRIVSDGRPVIAAVPAEGGKAALTVKVTYKGAVSEFTEVVRSGVDLMRGMRVRDDCLPVFGPAEAVTALRYPVDVRLGSDRAVQFDLDASEGAARIVVHLPALAIPADTERVVLKLYNLESRSLTAYLRLTAGGQTYDLEAKEFFANRTMLLTFERRTFGDRYPSVAPETLEICLRNTYPTDMATDMRILLGQMKAVRL